MITESPRTNNISDRFLTIFKISKIVLRMNQVSDRRELSLLWDEGTTYSDSRINIVFFNFNNGHCLFNIAQNHIEMAIICLLRKSTVCSSSEACVGKYMQSSIQFTVSAKFDIDFLVKG